MITMNLGKGRAVLAGLAFGIFSVLAGAVTFATPAHAASTVQIDWVDATTVKFSGSALKGPVTVAGSFVGNVSGTPQGSQTFLAASNGPVDMSFGCTVSITLNIYPDQTTGKLDYSHGEIIFTTDSPSTCSQDTLKANINGLTHDPNTGTANISLMNVPIGGLNNRGPGTGNDDAAHQIVNVTAGMGPASDFNNIPNTDVFMLCEAKGAYATNVDALTADCLNRKAGTLSAPPLTSNNLATLKDGKGPNGGDEKGWTGQFTGVKAGIYVLCSTNFKACQLFTKNPGQIADVYVIYGSTPGSTVPGTPPGQGAPSQVCTTGDGLAGALAWILCPAVQLIASATNFFENNIIVPFLTVSPLTTNAANPIYILWQDIRNVANIGFILFFFFVIFSQATSIGISNYGIKRILPKMAFVVVGVNLSYFIAAFIIDAFNIFGAGISALVVAALNQAGTTQLNSGTSAGTVRSIFTLGGAALLTIVVSGGAAIGWFFSFLGLALLVVVVVVIVLVVRQMAIIVLVILAPIAILMYMLPNTEGYYTKWRKTLTQLLMMYPLIVLLFAAGKIFGIILQQPDFKIAGDGVSDQVAQAVRVMLQFVIYVVPLVFLPATFAASGALMGRVYGALHNTRTRGLAQKPGKSFHENVVKPRRQELQMRAARRGGPVGWAAGYGYRRDFKREQRERELGRAKQAYIADQAQNERFAASAAGVGGAAGVTRVLGGAASQIEKTRQEEMANEAAILTGELRRLGISTKEFNNGLSSYLRGGTSTIVGTAADPTTPSGRAQLNLATDNRVMRAALNAAAGAGEIGTMEDARMRTGVDQTMVDDVIRNNEGKLKEKGGYHLATNMNLARGRMMQSNATGRGLDTTGAVFTGAPGQTPALLTTPAQMRTELAKQRLISIANTASGDITGMKSSLLDSMQKSLLQTDAAGNIIIDPATGRSVGLSADGAALLGSLDPAFVTQLRDRMTDITSNPNLIGKAQNREAILNVQMFV